MEGAPASINHSRHTCDWNMSKGCCGARLEVTSSSGGTLSDGCLGGVYMAAAAAASVAASSQIGESGAI